VKVVAVDWSSIALKCARHNAAIYEVSDRIVFLNRDFFEFTDWKETYDIDVLFFSPPWGGPEYRNYDDLDPYPLYVYKYDVY